MILLGAHIGGDTREGLESREGWVFEALGEGVDGDFLACNWKRVEEGVDRWVIGMLGMRDRCFMDKMEKERWACWFDQVKG